MKLGATDRVLAELKTAGRHGLSVAELAAVLHGSTEYRACAAIVSAVGRLRRRGWSIETKGILAGGRRGFRYVLKRKRKKAPDPKSSVDIPTYVC